MVLIVDTDNYTIEYGNDYFYYLFRDTIINIPEELLAA